jgi:hypothetical protein
MPLARLFPGLALAVLAALPALAGPVPDGKPAHYLDWWFERDVISRLSAHATTVPPLLWWPDHYPPPDDYAVANIGQLKHIATKAADEMIFRLPGGAGTEIDELLLRWANPAPPALPDDYAALNQEQLKYMARVQPGGDITMGSYTAKPSGVVYP